MSEFAELENPDTRCCQRLRGCADFRRDDRTLVVEANHPMPL